MSSRTLVLLDAAVEVVAAEGLRGLTHRAVDARAGVPAGSTSYYFRTRGALLSAALAHVLGRDLERIAAIGDVPPDRAALVEGIAASVEYLLGPGRATYLARLEMELAAARQPELRRQMDEAYRRIVAMSLPVAVTLGSTAPERDTHVLLMIADGLLIDAIRRPVDGTELRRRLRLLVDAAIPPDPLRM